MSLEQTPQQTAPVAPIQTPQQDAPAAPIQNVPAAPIQTPQQTAPAAPIQNVPEMNAPFGASNQTSSAVSGTANVADTNLTASSTTSSFSNDAHSAIIEQQRQQIEALMQQNNALNAQVVSMVNNGAQLNSAQPQQPQQFVQPQAGTPTQVQQMAQLGAQPDPLGTFNPPSLSNQEDYSLEALASEIGKDRPTH